MAVQRRGITIEFDANTTKLDQAIKNINKNISSTDTELRKVNKALKFNPSSVDLWKQKQQLLTQKIQDTQAKLDRLKEKQRQFDANGVDKNSEAYRKLQREIIETESKLKNFKSQLRELGNVNLKALGEQLKQIGNKMEEVGKGLTQKVTAPITAAYAASAKAALNYGDAIAKVSTIADESQVPIDDLKSGIMNLSNATGISSAELAEASYQALSASVETKDVMGFLEDASGLAKAGFLDSASAVDVLTTVINAYGYEAQDAENIASQLIQTQNDGKTTVNELAQAMGNVIPTASALNVPFEQLNASYVLMTKQGINTANATTYLNGMFTELADGGSDVSQILQNKTGKTFGQLMNEGASLGDILSILNESVDGDSEAFLNLWGNTRAGRGALSLLNGGVEEFNEEAEKMEGATGNVNKALKKLKTPGASARKALNKLVNVGIQIGDVLAPAIEKAADFISGLMDKFSDLSPTAKKAIVIIGGIVAAIGPAILLLGKTITTVGKLMIAGSKIIGVVKAAGSAISILSSGALLPIIAVIAAVVAAGVLLYKNWDKIKEVAADVKEKIVKAWNDLKTSITAILTKIKTTVANVWKSIKTTVVNLVKSLRTSVVTFWQKMKTTVITMATNLKTRIVNIWKAIRTGVVNIVKALRTSVVTFWQKLKTAVGTIVTAIKTRVLTVWRAIRTTVVNIVRALRTTVVTLWQKLKNGVVNFALKIKQNVANVWKSIKTTAVNLWNSIKTAISDRVKAIKEKVDFSNLISKVKDSVKGIKDALASPFQKAKDLVSNAIGAIKKIFPISLGKIFSGVKLPHFKISGGRVPWGIGGMGQKPSVSIEWYKKGGIMTRPTVFGGGEAGDEAILPLDPFWKKMDELIAAQQGGGITVNVYGTSNMSVEELAEAVERRLVSLQKRRYMAYGGI